MIRAHQPGSQPIDIPEVIPNPAVVPKQEPAPKEPAPKEPVKVPEKVPAGIVLPESSLAAANQCPRAHLGPGPSHFASWISLAPPDDMPTELENPQLIWRRSVKLPATSCPGAAVTSFWFSRYSRMPLLNCQRGGRHAVRGKATWRDAYPYCR